jgi:hypothetical protein
VKPINPFVKSVDRDGITDIAVKGRLEIEIREDGTVVWIHLEDGLTHFRACQIADLVITDNREPETLWLDTGDGFLHEIGEVARLKDGGIIVVKDGLVREFAEEDLVEEAEDDIPAEA